MAEGIVDYVTVQGEVDNVCGLVKTNGLSKALSVLENDKGISPIRLLKLKKEAQWAHANGVGGD